MQIIGLGDFGYFFSVYVYDVKATDEEEVTQLKEPDVCNRTDNNNNFPENVVHGNYNCCCPIPVRWDYIYSVIFSYVLLVSCVVISSQVMCSLIKHLCYNPTYLIGPSLLLVNHVCEYLV